ncbi:MAG: hypothetical protein EOO20_13360 [Chryseobacterium sp.]|nr:MAG: hypothetical protein EOO20_13360 [Chryseobacterium sp.]
MTKEQFAEKLNGREYREEMSHEEAKMAKEFGLVVVYGASDDLCEFRGCINEEIDCYEGKDLEFTLEHGAKDDDEDEVLRKHGHSTSYNRLEILWCKEDPYSWTYHTETPHATFDILEDGEKYCRGIVMSVYDLK